MVVNHKMFLVRLFCAPRLLRPGAATHLSPVSYATDTLNRAAVSRGGGSKGAQA